MIRVIDAGMETTVQDYPGRRGRRAAGIPPSGPYDDRSFRIANALLNNPPSAAGLEIQLIGPTLVFEAPTTIAVTGAETQVTIDGQRCPMWQTLEIAAGQQIQIGTASRGLRSYLAVAGGIQTAPVLGSRSTFARAGIGGVDGAALAAGMRIPIRKVLGIRPQFLSPNAIPDFSETAQIDVTPGPHGDWLDGAGHRTFLGSSWTVAAQSDRTGCRLIGPGLSFSGRATTKPPDNGSDPSNVVNTGYPLGGVNLAGTSPIVLPVDGPSQGGFITPYVVTAASMWLLGQAGAGQRIRFRAVTRSQARSRLLEHEKACTAVGHMIERDELTTASGAA
ncbi:biotin-dependent carboxyltransferase family protein [Mycolicibacterium sediminis]|uniref:Carboxyltransferase domain-containing protein n=1 Tax=Mycolicibacterium sediminis TaxID=1286180 RepID=A0A7I7QNC2_9MYCO|nr:biotin-dependent carboxyltransferase family protein [Mycolicibacterium sediminis]BBY27457.1 hypothetical protein MSEDJ_15530 [Mycolicibacterium sediminis]